MSEVDFASGERVEAVQATKLRGLLAHAAATVPYYSDLFARLDIDLNDCDPLAVLRELPVLTKADIEANFPDRILSGGRRPISARHVTTSGTTSDRIEVVLTVAAQHWRHAQQLWADEVGGGCTPGLRRLEIPPDACSRVCGQDGGRPDGLVAEMRWAARRSSRPARAVADSLARRAREALRTRILNDTTLPPLLGPEGTAATVEVVRQHVELIEREDPYLLSGLPTYLQEIARYLQRTGRRLRVPVVRPIGSVSSARMKRFVGENLGAEVFETYGSNELGCAACECQAHNGLHVAASCFVVEILRDGRPARPGELGRIAVTCLDNYSMPLIRYDIGDVGRWYPAGCKCGRNTPLIECNGRLQGLLITSSGAPVTEEQIMDLAYFDLGLEHFQLVERRPGQFDLMVVAAPEGTADMRTVREAFAHLLDEPERLEVFPVETIYPEATGKFRFVKSASYERFG
ncbi:MAG: phenylacetate--CoA ligase family protein [Armatimonadota bacterium]